jgi:signal transduction histidine kinase
MDIRKPSHFWRVAAAIAGGLAIVLGIAAFSMQAEATRPIGEGELFVRDATQAAAMADSTDELKTVVRRIRNRLQIEAVSYVTANGVLFASTSPSQEGATLANGVLAFGLRSSRFAAVAAPIVGAITIDGVTEWEAGDVLYRVLQPTAGGALLLDYDISELLARRAGSQGISGTALRTGLLAAVLALVSTAALVGHYRTARRYREIARESELLRLHAAELEKTNYELDHARRRAEAALELAEETNRIRAEFVLMINHELRTPLTAVVTGADILRSEPELAAESRQDILDAMVTDGGRLEEIIDQMLVVARIENRGLNLEFSPAPSADICASIVSTHPELRHDGEHPTASPSVWTDPATLTQLVHSLADNAMTHGAQTVTLSCTAGVPFEPQIEVGGRPDNPITFIVSDDGPGIDPDFLPRIFEKFEKQSFSSGTGLGLYMARMVVDALRGSIAVDTSPRGTRVAVSIARADQPSLSGREL